MAVGDTTTSFQYLPKPSEDTTGKPPSKPEPEPLPKTVQNHVYRTATEFATNDVEATTPTINPDDIMQFFVGRQRVYRPQVLWHGNMRIIYERSEHEETTTETVRRDFGYGEFVDEETTTTTTVVTYTPVDYNMTVVLGVALGPNVILRGVYADQNLIWEGDSGTGRSVLDMTVLDPNGNYGVEMIYHSGQNNQAPDPVLIDLIGADKVPGYVGLAYIIIPTIASKSFSGASFSFEIERYDFARRIPGDDYADPRNADGDVNGAAVIWEIMRSDWSGMAVRPEHFDVAAFQDLFDRFAARGYYFSLQDNSDAFGADMLDTIMALTGCVMFIDPATELITVKEYYHSLYDPDTAIVFDESNIIAMQEMPRPAWGTMPTHFDIKWTDRSDNYKAKTLRRVSRTINTDDKRSEMRLRSTNGSIICSIEVARKCLTRQIMHNGSPVQQLAFTANSDALKLTPGTAIKLSYAQYGISEAGFWVTEVQATSPDLNQYLVKGFYYERADVDDFDDGEDPSDFVKPVLRPIAPTEYEFVSDGILANVLRRLGVTKPYDQGKTFNSYALLFVRPESEGQVSVNVYNRQGALVRKNAVYSGHARFVGNMAKNYKATDGYIPSLTLEDGAGLAIIAGANLAYSAGEWLSYESASFSGTDVTLTNVQRGLWGSPLAAHADGSSIWFMDDSASRLFGPNAKNKTFHYQLTSNAFGGLGKIDGTELDVSVTFAEISNYDFMDAPNVIYLNGNRVLDGQRPTIYQDVEYTLLWLNRNRQVTDFIGMTDGDGQSAELLSASSDGYSCDLWDSANVNHPLGISFSPTTDYVSAFGFNYVKFTCNAIMGAANGDGYVYIDHRMFNSNAAARPVHFEFTLEDQPGLMVDFGFNYRVGFAAEFNFDFANIGV